MWVETGEARGGSDSERMCTDQIIVCTRLEAQYTESKVRRAMDV